MTIMLDRIGATGSLANLLQDYTVEVTSRDRKSLEAAPQVLRPGTEVFIAALPGDSMDKLVNAAAGLRKGGLHPVPHIVARNLESVAELDKTLARLTQEAGVDRILALGGDRDHPAGKLTSSLEIIQTGLIEKHGIGRIYIGCYPEGHPKIPDAVLDQARADKLAAAEKAGLNVTLVSQFCFASEPVISLTKRMRAQGVKAPFRVGVAGPADRALLIKYALICGVGNSIRVLKDRGEMTKNLLSSETPETLISELALAQAADPALGLCGVHFFTFGSVIRSAQWADAHRR